MKLAVLSDIHANRHALEAVLADVERAAPDRLVCLGDLVGGGAHPNEVIDLILSRRIPTVMGNHDEAVGFDLDDSGGACRDRDEGRCRRLSLLWTRRHTTPDRKAFLRELPLQNRQDIAGRHVLLVHGSPRGIHEGLFADRLAATFESVARVAGCDVLLCGHTHQPYRKAVGRTLFVNAGSVGQPQDGDPRAGYALLEFGRSTRVAFRRVAYDVAAAAHAVREAGLPPQIADRLERGGQALPVRPEGARP